MENCYKVFFTGLLTVEPSKRLTMDDLKENEWLNRHNSLVFSCTPLRTPGVLNSSVSSQLSATLGAFHKATREGFRLQDVAKAPLVMKRRKMMKNSVEDRSFSSDSASSGESSSQVQQTLQRKLSSDTSSVCSMGFIPQTEERDVCSQGLIPSEQTEDVSQLFQSSRGDKRKLSSDNEEEVIVIEDNSEEFTASEDDDDEDRTSPIVIDD